VRTLYKKQKFVFNTFIYFKWKDPRTGKTRLSCSRIAWEDLGALTNSTCKRISNKIRPKLLVTEVRFRVSNGSSVGTGSLKIENRDKDENNSEVHEYKHSKMRFRQRKDMIREIEVFIKIK